MTAASGRPADLAIVGAGIIGSACALRAALAGHDVLLVDRAEPGSGCSRGNAGHIATQAIEPLASPQTLGKALRYLFGRASPLRVRPAYAARALPWLARFALAARRVEAGTTALASLQRLSLDAFRRLLHDAGLRDLLVTRGHLLVAESAAGEAALSELAAALAPHGIHPARQGRADIEDAAPGLAASVQAGLRFPGTAHVTDPLAVCLGLVEALVRTGGRFETAEVRRIHPGPGAGFELETEALRIACRQVVVAAGAWSASLLGPLGHSVPLDTERGYHLTLPGRGPGLACPVASVERHTIMTPLAPGLRITGFVELGGLELPPSPALTGELDSHLRALLPGIETKDASGWMGFRPSLPDHLPVIGRSRRHDGLLFAFGHQHLGLTLSGITAEIVVALLERRDAAVDVLPFRAERFDSWQRHH